MKRRAAVALEGNPKFRIHATEGDYAVEYRLTPLHEVAGKTKVMDATMIAKSANDITKTFTDYARPLIGGGWPEISRLDTANRVEKRLKP